MSAPLQDPEAVRREACDATDLGVLTDRVRTCTACPELAATRVQVVPGSVPPPGPTVRLLVMGEAPGANEDQTGLPFVGRSGQLLDELLALVGVARADVAVLNTIKCRPPGNRPPSRVESDTCRPWTQRQLELAGPQVVVALGLSATRWFLGPTTLAAVRGTVHEVAGLRVLPTYHPSAALRGGPSGDPRRLLAEDLATAVRLAGAAR